MRVDPVVINRDKTLRELIRVVNELDGISGVAGAPWIVGEGPPSASAGNDGELYLNLLTGDLYLKDSGIWALELSIIGPKGDTGSTGATGATGATGSPGPPGPAATRELVEFTTISLTNEAVSNTTVNFGKAFDLLKIEASAACRIRFYATAAARTADASRPSTERPAAGIGLIAEFVFSGAGAIVCSPIPTGANLEGSPSIAIPIAVQNLSGGTTTIDFDFTILAREAA